MEFGEKKEGVEERRESFKGEFEDLSLDRFIVRTPHNWAGDYDEMGHGLADSPDMKFTPCTFLWYSMTIFFDGTIAPCPQDFYGKINLGNVAKTSVADVWNGEEMRKLRRKMKERNVEGISPCDTCDMLTRKTFMGVPTNYLSTFLKDNLVVK